MCIRDRAEVIRDESAPFGWKLVAWGSADDLEDASLDQGSGTPELREYVDERLGFSLMYPALIPEQSVTQRRAAWRPSPRTAR